MNSPEIQKHPSFEGRGFTFWKGYFVDWEGFRSDFSLEPYPNPSRSF